MSLTEQMNAMGDAARKAAAVISQADHATKNAALLAAATALRAAAPNILAANKEDMDAATHLDAAMQDRLLLTDTRIEAMAAGLDAVALLPDPVGRVLAEWDNPENQLHFQKVAVPLGVIGMIYESRPNVTADAAALALKSGNAILLRGGSESLRSSLAILKTLQAGLKEAGLPAEAIQLIPVADREAVAWMLNAHAYLDVLIPRGGRSLTERVRKDSRVPTLLHLDGNCHIYVHRACAPEKVSAIVMNAKLRRTGICGAMESLLIDRAAPEGVLKVISGLLDAGCEVRGDATIMKLDARVKPASEADWSTEYLAPILSVKMVDGLGDAIVHINRYGSHHTDAILTEDADAAVRFTREVDSAIVLVNASTQFADGGEFGFGGEIGIATGRLHARGPVGAPELTTYKYIITTANEGGAIRAG